MYLEKGEGLGVDWEDNIRMDLKEIGINTRNWVECGIEPPGSISHGVS